jgi:hypothetical protein
MHAFEHSVMRAVPRIYRLPVVTYPSMQLKACMKIMYLQETQLGTDDISELFGEQLGHCCKCPTSDENIHWYDMFHSCNLDH